MGSGQFQLRRAVVAGLHGEDISGAEDERGAGVLPIDLNAVFDPGEPGDGMGRKMKLGPEDMADSGAVFFGGDGFRDGFHVRSLLSFFRIAQTGWID